MIKFIKSNIKNDYLNVNQIIHFNLNIEENEIFFDILFESVACSCFYKYKNKEKAEKKFNKFLEFLKNKETFFDMEEDNFETYMKKYNNNF